MGSHLDLNDVAAGHPMAMKELSKLRQDLYHAKAAHKSIAEAFDRNVVAMQSAWIEWKRGGGAEEAMQWIENTLDGPGLTPFDSDTRSAQEYFDQEAPPL